MWGRVIRLCSWSCRDWMFLAVGIDRARHDHRAILVDVDCEPGAGAALTAQLKAHHVSASVVNRSSFYQFSEVDGEL